MRHFLHCLWILALAASACESNSSQKVDFNTQIRPILNEKCLSCHGGVKKNGGLGLRFREEALAPAESGLAAIVPGDPNASELMVRVLHHDPEERMPLDQEPLNAEEIALLRSWIAEGAEWDEHWAFVPPQPQVLPSSSSDWIRNQIDAWVWDKLEQAGIEPSAPADKEILIRRLSLDLTGLPPSPREVQDFLDDDSPEAYEKLVDRLLASPHFGERWASMWLDLARYADSQGYQKDRFRSMWRYRDWVIKAFNEDKPFDQFTIEQLAGDMLAAPTVDQMIATAFHRNTMSNDEGGTDDEEFRVTAVIDRVNTTMEVWQGITIGCVQCHHHPYDPFEQQEFYELYAYFNTAMDSDRSDDFPRLKDWLSEQERDEQTEWLAELSQDKTPIMLDLPLDSSRTTRIFERGNWLVHGDTVWPGVPQTLGPMPEDYPANRLGLAQWLMSEHNPLTSRVIVNRFWEQLFGRGLVPTLEDFGTQGEAPYHQALLDYLAIAFREQHQWSVKSLLKQIAMSATYRQASDIIPQMAERDPDNQMLARGPRFRLSAEQVRDQALAVSGLLSRKQYGPSVMPPQPKGTWQVIRNVMRWRPSEGEDRYRRGLYTFWRRSSPFPSMLTFDSPSRELCVSRRIRTNTPLQALVTLNDSSFVEASVALADRMQKELMAPPQEKLKYAYQLALCHPPSTEQARMLAEFYDTAVAFYEEHPEEIPRLLRGKMEDSAQNAALVNVANVILNLDEFVMKS
jgi:hypothetical protein